MFEKYGLLIALFILALCVNSNIITESHMAGTLIDITVMVSCVFAAWIIKNKQSGSN
ncbi:hypothetical protein ACQP3R_17115 [Bacillus inaquosorum]|uniref:hypothetical protein n=1 Tax=Bacillus inaquosorum TaxID=483913 RepID=UPI003D0533CE